MNTQHLQYIIEIERTRSISQAAENLFVGQPNLSRILRDMEEAVGFAIFERTSKGVRPTDRGAVFLQHARSGIHRRIGPAQSGAQPSARMHSPLDAGIRRGGGLSRSASSPAKPERRDSGVSRPAGASMADQRRR